MSKIEQFPSRKGDPLKAKQPGSRRKQFRNWGIIFGLVILGVILWRILAGLGNTTEITQTILPCYAHQDVTVFGDGVLYYDEESLHCISSTGGVRWSYRVGGGAQFATSNTHVVIWQDSRLSILDKNGVPTYNNNQGQTVQLARISDRYCVVVTGEETEPVLTILDLQGTLLEQMDKELFSGMLMLDAGFYGKEGQYMWTMAMDVYGPALSTTINLFQVGNKMNLGVLTLGENLVYRVFFDGSVLRVFSTQHMYAYDYKGVQDVSNTMLVYGWRLQDVFIPERGNASILLAPTDQTSAMPAITELRVLNGKNDRYYTLPTACLGAAVNGKSIYAFSNSYLYRTSQDSQRFYAYAYNLPDNQQVNAYIGMTSDGRAIVSSGSSVFSVSLPQ